MTAVASLTRVRVVVDSTLPTSLQRVKVRSRTDILISVLLSLSLTFNGHIKITQLYGPLYSNKVIGTLAAAPPSPLLAVHQT